MRAAPPLQIHSSRYGLWRCGVLLLAAVACAAMAAWWSAQPAPAPPWANAVALGGALAALACAGGLWRQRPIGLRWDRQRWHFAHDTAAEQPGEVSVAIDLGAWMLLRFVPERPRFGLPRWIALQQRGLEPQWHALRCTLYGARAARRDGATSPSSAAE